MSKTIYVVEGSCGEYSDHVDWLVKAFVDEEAAKQFVLACTAQGKQIVAFDQREDTEFGKKWKYSNKAKQACIELELGLSLLDPAFDYDYSGFNYTYYPVELEEK